MLSGFVYVYVSLPFIFMEYLGAFEGKLLWVANTFCASNQIPNASSCGQSCRGFEDFRTECLLFRCYRKKSRVKLAFELLLKMPYGVLASQSNDVKQVGSIFCTQNQTKHRRLKFSTCKMEETEILENQNVPQTDKMKAASAHSEHNELHFMNHSYSEDSKESLGQMSLEQNKFSAVKNLTKQQSHLHNSEESRAQENRNEITRKPAETEKKRDISSNEKETKYFVLNNSNESKEQYQEEAKIERNRCKELIIDKISDETISPKTKAQSQMKLNDAVSDKTLTIENARKSKQLIAEETLKSPKEESSNVVENLPNPPEKPVKEELQEAKEQDTIIPQSEEVKIEKLDQMEASTSSAAQEAEMKKPNEVMPGKEEYIDPREKIRKDMEEYFSGIQALEVKKTIRDELSAKEGEVILREDQRKKTWKGMLLSVTHTTLSTST